MGEKSRADGAKSGHGGARAGAGRKPRARIIRETAVDVVLARRSSGGREPLQVMLDAMDDVLSESGPVAAFPFAQACAPYMHAKLGNLDVQHTGPGGGPVQTVTMTPDEFRAIASDIAGRV